MTTRILLPNYAIVSGTDRTVYLYVAEIATLDLLDPDDLRQAGLPDHALLALRREAHDVCEDSMDWPEAVTWPHLFFLDPNTGEVLDRWRSTSRWPALAARLAEVRHA